MNKKSSISILIFIIALLIFNAYPENEKVPSALDQLEEQLTLSWKELSKAIPENQTLVIAVMPFRDNFDGITLLGEHCANVLKEIIPKYSPNVKLTERKQLEVVMKEQEAWIDTMFENRTPTYRSISQGVLKTDALVLGTLTPTKDKILVYLKLDAVSSGAIKSQKNFSIPIDDNIKSLLLYVQRPKKESTKPTEVPPIELRYRINATHFLSDGSKQDFSIKDIAELRCGDYIDIYFTPISDCWVYILYHSSSGKWDTLFPHPLIKLGNFCPGGVTYKVTDPDIQGTPRCYELDDVPGTETIFIIASYEKLNDIKLLLSELNGVSTDKNNEISKKLENAIQTRGIEDKSKSVEGITLRSIPDNITRGMFVTPNLQGEEVLKGKFDVMKKITIIHRS